MKHFLLTLLLTFIVGISSAQTEHMKFKGIPLEGTLHTFKIQLEITHQSMTCYVMLSYFDNANQEKLRKQIMDDL